MSDAELAEELKKWFDKNLGTSNVWNKSKTGKVIKRELVKAGHFKSKPRGNPSEGKRQQLLSQSGQR